MYFMPITMAVWSSEVHIFSLPVNWDRGVKSYWNVDVCLRFSCVLLFCTGRGIVMAPSKESYQTQTNKIYTLANWETLGSTCLWATLNGLVYILKLEYHYPIKLKYVVYLPVLKMVDDNHHWHKLFKCTSTVCNVMLVHCTRGTLLFVFMAEFC
jgi:hypothetical protein